MKRMIALLLAVMLAGVAAAAFAETPVFDTLAGMEWTFCSGVGAWSTELQIRADGSFSGSFHDSEMGESAEDYPDGTVYVCTFSGRMSLAGQKDENTWEIRVDKLEKEAAEETISDGIRYVPADPYGLSEGDVMLLYAPGTPVNIFSEDMQLWAHVLEEETPPLALEHWFLCSEKNDSGFVGEEPVGLANPWEDMTAEQLEEAAGITFGVPEGATNVIIRYLRSDSLAEMHFTIDGDEYCARIQPAAPEGGQLPDISGMYYDWVNVEPVDIRGNQGTIGQAQDGSEWVELCQWYDTGRGLMYALSVQTTELDGLDLTAVAEQI